jgi:hypothetical protein
VVLANRLVLQAAGRRRRCNCLGEGSFKSFCSRTDGWPANPCLSRLSSVAVEVAGYLTLKVTLQLQPRARNIRASFCPLLSLEKGEFIGKLEESK